MIQLARYNQLICFSIVLIVKANITIAAIDGISADFSYLFLVWHFSILEGSKVPKPYHFYHHATVPTYIFPMSRFYIALFDHCVLQGRVYSLMPKEPLKLLYGHSFIYTPSSEYTLGTRTLKKGSKGTDVKALQEFLLQLGYSLPKYGADGDFGRETETALKRFQAKAGITQDGVYGSKTHKALMESIADHDDGKEPAVSENSEKADGVAEQPAAKRVRIVCNSGSVNIRVGNGTQYDRITAVKDGTSFEWVATAENGWHAIVVNGRVGWFSGKYSQIA